MHRPHYMCCHGYQAMKQESNEVKQMAALVITFLAKSSPQPLPGASQRLLVPMLVNGTKEKNTLVRTNSECGLVALLRLRDGDAVYKVRKVLTIELQSAKLMLELE